MGFNSGFKGLMKKEIRKITSITPFSIKIVLISSQLQKEYTFTGQAEKPAFWYTTVLHILTYFTSY